MNKTLQERTIEQNNITNPKHELVIFGGYAGFYIVVVWLASLMTKYYPLTWFTSSRIDDPLWFGVWYAIVAKFIFLFVVPIFIYQYLGYNVMSLFQYKSKSIINNVLISFIFFMIGFSMNQSYIVPILQHGNIGAGGVLIALVVILLTAAIPEEIFYRVILQTRIETTYGKLVGIIGSSFACAMFHFPSRFILANGIEGMAGNAGSVLSGTLIPVFILSIIFGTLWSRFRNLYMLLALHAGIDFLPLFSLLAGCF